MSAKALANVEIAGDRLAKRPGALTTASPTGTLVSIARSTKSCRFCFGRVAGGMVRRGFSACRRELTPIVNTPRRFGLERRVDQGGVDAVGVDEDQEVAAAEPPVGDHHSAVAGRALHRHRAQRAVGEQRALVEDRGHVHQPAGAEEDLLRSEVRVAAGAEDVDQAVGGDLVGQPRGGRVERFALLVEDRRMSVRSPIPR